MHTIGIIQPNYIPWRGYFDFIYEVDTFVFLDDVQYTTRDWRNRNRVREVDGGTKWLTVPVIGGRDQLIKDVRIDSTQKWEKKHLGTMRHNYSKTPFFATYFEVLQDLYTPGRYEYLADLDIDLTRKIAEWLGLRTAFARSSGLGTDGSKDDKLCAITTELGGDRYLSGPTARDYMRPELWAAAGVDLRYKDYSGYPPYPQISEPFEPSVSILDLLFMVGPEAPEYIWGAYRNRDGDLYVGSGDS